MSENSKKTQIATLLTKLSLHFPRTDLEPSQFKLVMADMVGDLEQFSIFEIERAVATWRQSGERFFPNSGQLIVKIREAREASIARARGASSSSRLSAPAGKYPREHRPWRDILRDHGTPIPADDSPVARALDRLQNHSEAPLRNGFT